jgi:hypothetical protein
MRRRDFLQTSAAALPGLGLIRPARAKNCIVLMLVGGPSHLDTWDMKPEAPSDIRGPFRPIRTNVQGIEISEIFPRMARHADKYALIRSVWSDAPALHDAGHHLLQTGRLSGDAPEQPHVGSLLAKFTGERPVVLPHLIGNTGGDMTHGQTAGHLGAEFNPRLMSESEFDLRGEPESSRRRYGLNRFGQSCLMARRLTESGTRFVTVNMFETVFGETTWDIHGYSPFSPISCYRDHVGPMFDAAYSSLLEDLSDRSLLDETLVIAMGEFGRTPKINPAGGRDHWPQCSTIVLAGGGVSGGQVHGSSDSVGAEPRDNPVYAGRVAATIRHALGMPADLTGMQAIPVFAVAPS